jgi:hypothetical protein
MATLAKSLPDEEAQMNEMRSEPEAQVQLALLAKQYVDLEWAGVLDCGALGPSQEEPALFYQPAQIRGEE